ncbi:ABC transporter permease [bacterium]|nr:ABC transporter permease [bacterium]
MKDLLVNPLVIKQLREEMRSRKIFFLVPVYIAILSSIALIAVGSSTSSTFNPVTLSSNAKVTLFSFVVAVSILLGLIALILGAASFTTEKERSTYELLELTPLSYIQLVLGKFLHSFIIIGLILFSSLPIFSTLFFMGGLTYLDLVLPLLYLILFFGVVILAAICISIGSNRTIIGIILSLLVGFVSYISLAILGGSAYREPADVGYAVLSPWLVIWRQIFAPVPLKIWGVDVPVWTIYCTLYILIGCLFVAWGHNALDTRKLQRNPRARIIGLALINLYTATGILCLNSYRPFTAKQVEDQYQILFAALMVTLPFFVMGVFTEQDEKRFRQKPLRQTLHLKNLFLNHPATGPFYLLIVLTSISLNIVLCTAVPPTVVFRALFILLLWIFPWLLFFIAMRLSGVQARGIFVSYILGVLLVILASAFYHSGKSATTIFDFFLVTPILVAVYIASLAFFTIASLRASKHLRQAG